MAIGLICRWCCPREAALIVELPSLSCIRVSPSVGSFILVRSPIGSRDCCTPVDSDDLATVPSLLCVRRCRTGAFFFLTEYEELVRGGATPFLTSRHVSERQRRRLRRKNILCDPFYVYEHGRAGANLSAAEEKVGSEPRTRFRLRFLQLAQIQLFGRRPAAKEAPSFAASGRPSIV